jgi:hypothetical protein
MLKKLTTAAAMVLMVSSFAFAGQGRTKPLDQTGIVTSQSARASQNRERVKKHRKHHRKHHRNCKS